MNLLITGAAGALGHFLCRGLAADGYRIKGFDQAALPREIPGVEHHVGDIQDAMALAKLCEGVETILHLAGVPERDNFKEQLVPNNIVGTQCVLEAARLSGVRRIIYASSCRVVGGLDWSQEGPISLDAGLVPGDHYGITKATGELLGRMYASRFGISVLCARLGWFVRNRDEASQVEKVDCGRRIYLSHNDALGFFRLTLTQPLPSFSAVFVTSQNGGAPLFDPAPAEQLLGFRAQDTWPEGSTWSTELYFSSPRHAPSLLPDEPDGSQ